MAFQLNEEIPLHATPGPFNNGLAQLGQIRAQQQQAALLQQQGAAQQQEGVLRQQRIDAGADEATARAAQLREKDIVKHIIGNPDITPETMRAQIAQQAPGQLDAFDAQVQKHQQNLLSVVDTANKMKAASDVAVSGILDDIKATGYQPVATEASLKLIEQQLPSFKAHADQIRQSILGGMPIKDAVEQFRPKTPDPKPEAFTLKPGEQRFGPAGQPIASVPDKSNEITPFQTATLAGQAATRAEQAIHNRATEAQGRATLAQGSGGAMDAKDAVSGMKAGTLPPMLPGRASKEYVAMLAESKRQGYDLATAATDWNATQKHVATLNNNQQTKLLQSINTAAQSVDVIDDLVKQWDGGKYPMLNAVTLKLAKSGALRKDAQSIATKLDGQITDVTSELAQVYMGGGTPTDQALKLASQNLQGSWSKKVLLDMTNLTRQNLKIRSNSMKNVGVQGASESNPYAGAQGGPAAAPTAAPAGPTAAEKAAALLKKYGGG